MKLDSPINDFYNEILNLIPPEVDKENLTIDVQDIVEKTLNETTPILLNSLRKQQGEMLEEHRLIRAEFEARLSRRWLKPLALFESLIVVSLESCEELYQELSEEMETNMKFKVLVRLHARACQISYEVLALVRSGFADGAMARWRTLHELSVLAFSFHKMILKLLKCIWIMKLLNNTMRCRSTLNMPQNLVTVN